MGWLPKKTIVVPVDFSEPSFEAVKLATEMVAEPEGLHVLSVQPTEKESIAGHYILSDDERVDNTRKNLRSELAKHGIEGAQTTVLVGSPGVEIVNYAREVNADLIVIPSHGRTGLKHLLLGSVAERVARHAPCPVLILRRND